jgi:hypothetical protein
VDVQVRLRQLRDEFARNPGFRHGDSAMRVRPRA